MWLLLQYLFSSDTVILIRLPDSAFIFPVEVWVIIKALEQIKYSIPCKSIIYTDSLSYLKLEHRDGESKVSRFKNYHLVDYNLHSVEQSS